MVLKLFDQHFGRGYRVYEKSLRTTEDASAFLVKGEEGKRLVVVSEKTLDFPFEKRYEIEGKIFLFCKMDHENLEKLVKLFPELKPSTCGLKPSFGTGDRLGITTPAHVRALEGTGVFPVFAQQSVRENERTGRTWRDVLADAVWGVFQEGYRGEFGADADHVKREEDLLKAAEEGFTMFTIDPSEHVRNLSKLSEREKNEILEKTLKKDRVDRRYLGKRYTILGERFEFDEKTLRDAVVLYYDAIAHVEMMYQLLRERTREFDFEVSVDETETPTAPLHHIFIVEELRRRGVEFTNLALRFVGDWEKGVDYKGDVKAFEREIKIHAEIARMLQGYKLSLHSGSDKFSIYRPFALATQGLFHVKTAGTSYLEAVKVVSMVSPSLYREIHRVALENFEKDRKSYFISADLSKIPDVEGIRDEELPKLFEDPNVRQLVHVTYGSVLKDMELKKKIFEVLEKNEELFHEVVKNHIEKHVKLLKG